MARHVRRATVPLATLAPLAHIDVSPLVTPEEFIDAVLKLPPEEGINPANRRRWLELTAATQRSREAKIAELISACASIRIVVRINTGS